MEFGGDLSFTYVMGGLARDYEAGYSDSDAWLERAAESRMPVDPRIWTESPIRSTFPACIAVKAAAEQGPAAEERYLRAVREGLMCFRRRLDNVEALVEVAREAALDARRFRIDVESNAILERFGADLEETRRGDEPFVLPSARFEGGGDRSWVPGDAPYGDWRAAAVAAGARPSKEPRPEPLSALQRFGRMATVEVEAVCDLSAPSAEAELWRLAVEGRLRPLRVLTGVLWELA